MDFISWSDKFSVGVSRFDEEHKHLISLINKLNQAIQVGTAKKTMEEALNELANYTAVHFKHEEENMLKYNYPGYEKQKQEHDGLKRKVGDFNDRYKAGSAAFSLELISFLKDWLTGHILGSDMQYKEFFADKDVQ